MGRSDAAALEAAALHLAEAAGAGKACLSPEAGPGPPLHRGGGSSISQEVGVEVTRARSETLSRTTGFRQVKFFFFLCLFVDDVQKSPAEGKGGSHEKGGPGIFMKRRLLYNNTVNIIT